MYIPSSLAAQHYLLLLPHTCTQTQLLAKRSLDVLRLIADCHLEPPLLYGHLNIRKAPRGIFVHLICEYLSFVLHWGYFWISSYSRTTGRAIFPASKLQEHKHSVATDLHSQGNFVHRNPTDFLPAKFKLETFKATCFSCYHTLAYNYVL